MILLAAFAGNLIGSVAYQMLFAKRVASWGDRLYDWWYFGRYLKRTIR